MRIDIVIDGYNLMHAAGLARRSYGPGDLERCRHRLLNFIRRGLAPDQRARTTILFDGKGTDNSSQLDFRFHGLTVGFSPAGQEADDLIEQFILEHSFPKQLIVVSSDHRLHKAARARRSTAIDSEEFVRQLEQVTDVPGTDPPRLRSPASEKPEVGETHEWMQEFGDIDLSEIERSVQREARIEKLVDSKPTSEETAQPRQQTGITPDKPPKKTCQPEDFDDELPLDQNPLDLDFWEKRIAELDREGY